MIRHKITGLLMILLFAVAGMAQNPSTATVYAVGTCKPTLPSFSTINAALAANPAPSVVQVCPGTYSEQVVITQGVTLQGVSIAGLGQAIVQAPSGGLSALATNGSLQPVAPLLWANSAAGPVTVNDITFDGSTAGSISAIIAGIFLQNSTATINRVGVRNLQVTGPFSDIGVYIEGGASSPVITVENSSIHDIRSIGIYTETPSGGGSLSATLKGNYVSAKTSGIFLDSGSAGTVTGNNISGGNTGIGTNVNATEAISGNTIMGSGFSISASDGSTVSGNKIFGRSEEHTSE